MLAYHKQKKLETNYLNSKRLESELSLTQKYIHNYLITYPLFQIASI